MLRKACTVVQSIKLLNYEDFTRANDFLMFMEH